MEERNSHEEEVKKEKYKMEVVSIVYICREIRFKELSVQGVYT